MRRKVGEAIVDTREESIHHPIIPKEKSERTTPIDFAAKGILKGAKPGYYKEKPKQETYA